MLTTREEEIFKIIKEYFKIYGISPSMQDVADRAGISVTRIKHYYEVLDKKKYIKKINKVARSIVVLK